MSRRGVYIALILIVLGAYFLIVQFDPRMPDLDRMWPAFPLAGGIVAFASYLSGEYRDPAAVFAGTALTLMGMFLFLITMGSEVPDYTVLNILWPVFVIIMGISFLAFWLSQGRRDWEALFLAVVTMVFGIGCLAVNVGLLGTRTVHGLSSLWPVLLILVGLIMLIRRTFSRRGADQ